MGAFNKLISKESKLLVVINWILDNYKLQKKVDLLGSADLVASVCLCICGYIVATCSCSWATHTLTILCYALGLFD